MSLRTRYLAVVDCIRQDDLGCVNEQRDGFMTQASQPQNFDSDGDGVGCET